MKHLPPRFYVAAAAMTALTLMMPVLVFADSGRWKDNGNQTLTDTFTGLVWTKHDNLKDIDWEDAKRYCDTLTTAGYHWRLPDVAELAAIYTGGRDGTTQCRDETCKVSSLFYLTYSVYWSSTSAGDDNGSTLAWMAYLSNGYRLLWNVGDPTYLGRALCVRRS